MILCVVCELRELERGLVCAGDERTLDERLGRLVELHALLPFALAPGSGGAEKVSGSRDAPLGVRVDVLDQLIGTVDRELDAIHDRDRDQTGVVPLVSWLDQNVRAWAEYAPHGSTRLPPPTVSSLTGWLRSRLPWACQTYPGMPDFAAELATYKRHLERALGQDLRPTRYETPCPYCHVRLLFRKAGGDYIECKSCRRLWKDDEYAQLAAMAVDEHRDSA